MTAETVARKAVVTTAQVQEALTSYLKVRSELGFQDNPMEFDKGFRGKGFAVYSGDAVVNTFETKEEAYVHFSRYSEVAAEVLTQIVKNQAESETVKHATEQQIEDALTSGEAVKKAASRKAAA